MLMLCTKRFEVRRGSYPVRQRCRSFVTICMYILQLKFQSRQLQSIAKCNSVFEYSFVNLAQHRTQLLDWDVCGVTTPAILL